MRDFVLSDVCEEEFEWTDNYVAGEFDADDSIVDKDGNLLNTPYELFDVPLQDYVVNREKINAYDTYFFQALEAKENIGSATNDGWVFAMILEAYRSYAEQHNYEFVDTDGTIIPMIRLSRSKFFKYHFTYIRGLQDFVVTGVKHNDNGSKDFESIFLRNIADEKNAKKVRDILQGPLELSSKEASDILRIVTWAEMSGVRRACSAFLKRYNKGNTPYLPVDIEALEKFETFIQRNTYFGKLLYPLYEVIYFHEHAQEIQAERQEADLQKMLAEIDMELVSV